MVSALDVAAYILRKCGAMTAWKLQKLVYYCQAWSLVWDEPLFREKIEAWANGPVVRKLYQEHRGRYLVGKISKGNPDKLKPRQRETVDAVLEYYGHRPSQYLSDLTHMEDPWRLARSETPDRRRSDAVITLESMAEYYGSLAPNEP